MTVVNNRAFDTELLDAMSQRVLVGAMNTQLQAAGLNDTRLHVIGTECVRLQSG